MKRLLVFFVVLMTFTLAWPNAPPVLLDLGVTVEFLADNLEIDYDFVSVDAIQTVDILQIELPLAFYVISIPVMTISTDPGTLDVNYVNYTILEATQENRWTMSNLFWQCNATSTNLTHQINLATNQTEYMIVDPSRLDIGEYSLHMLCDN